MPSRATVYRDPSHYREPVGRYLVQLNWSLIVELWQLKQRQALPLEAKIQMALLRIREWQDGWEDDTFVSFSGGIDSTVLLHLVRTNYPNTPAMFVNTGLEFPEIVRFVKGTPNCTIIRPKMKFKEVLVKYGYPVVSKEQSQYIREYRNATSEKLRNLRMNGRPGKSLQGKISEKWKYLIEAPFLISDKCCTALKKNPARQFCKHTGLKPYIGNKSADSRLREQAYLKSGCNAFHTNNPTSYPLAVWSDQDVREYIRLYDIPYCDIYDKGYTTTGCVFCMFGCHRESAPNKFQQLAETHPKLWKYCIYKLDLKTPLEFMKIPYEPQPKQLEMEF